MTEPVLGIDIAKLKFNVCLININGKLKHKVLPNTSTGFEQLKNGSPSKASSAFTPASKPLALTAKRSRSFSTKRVTPSASSTRQPSKPSLKVGSHAPKQTAWMPNSSHALPGARASCMGATAARSARTTSTCAPS